MVARLASKPALLIGVLVVVGFAAAAIVLTYTNTSTVTTSVTAAPIQYLAGTDAGPSTLSSYVTAYTISTNKTYFTATVKGVPESSVVVGDFVQITNVDSASHAINISTPQVTNAYVSAYKLDVYNATNALQGTLTLTAATPYTALTVPAGATWYGKLTLTLATGAGNDNVALSNALTMTVT